MRLTAVIIPIVVVLTLLGLAALPIGYAQPINRTTAQYLPAVFKEGSTETVTLPTPTPTTETAPLPTPTPTIDIPDTDLIAIVYGNGGYGRSPYQIIVLDPIGEYRVELTSEFPYIGDLAWNQQGTQLAFTIDDTSPGDTIAVVNADGSNYRVLSTSGKHYRDISPVWSPDGRTLAFVSNRDGNDEIYTMQADGSNQVRRTNDPATDGDPQWSSDGQTLTFVSNRDGSSEIYTMQADGTGVVQLTNHVGDSRSPELSPDGRQFVFTSTRDGNSELYTMQADGSNQIRRTMTISSTNEANPTWSPDGRQIAFYTEYVDFRTNMTIVSMGTDDWTPRVLESCPAYMIVSCYNPEWSPDGTKLAYGVSSAMAHTISSEIIAIDESGTSVNLSSSISYAWRPRHIQP